MRKSVYEIVTDRIIQKLEEGVVPWQKPWNTGKAVNWKTQKPYRGVNAFMLENGEYATFKQIQEAGGRVKKGAKSEIVVFWKWIEKENEETGEKESIPLLRYYNVFEINTQCEGLESKRKIETKDHDPIEEAEKVVKNYMDAPKIRYGCGDAYYNKVLDFIEVPELKYFNSAEEFYSTLYHEMIHSTGHPRRLNRTELVHSAAFGSELYSKEELTAEMGAAMLCGIVGIDNMVINNSASYIQSWIRKLKNDKTLVVQAAAKAQKAVDYILGRSAD